MKNNKSILTARRRNLAITLLTTPLLLASLAEAQTPKRLLAYYRVSDKQATPKYNASNIPYAELTHIIHVAVQVEAAGDGSIQILTGALEPDLTRLAHAMGDLVLVSPHGDAAAFSSIAASPANRIRFAQNLMKFVTANSYDGVDIDWEVPEPADQTNCTALMDAIRQALPSPQYQLSMAVTATPGSRGSYDFHALNRIVDFYNVMAYNFHGPWSAHAGHHAPLFANQADPEHEKGVDAVIDTYVNTLGVPSSKINLGTAFYGYEFPVANLWDKCDNCTTAVVARKYGDYIKPRIGQNGRSNAFTNHLDPVAMAPYLTSNDPSHPSFITYDDAASTTRKVVYALQVRDLGGMFMWEISQDFDGKGQDLMDAMHSAYCTVAPALQPDPVSPLAGINAGQVRKPTSQICPLR